MIVLVCGGRDYHDHEIIIKALNSMNEKHGIELLIEGGAKGADAHAATWADNNGIPRCTFHANWDYLGPKAGPIRNQNMLKFGKPECLVAFTGGRGTKNMISRARSWAIPVWEIS